MSRSLRAAARTSTGAPPASPAPSEAAPRINVFRVVMVPVDPPTPWSVSDLVFTAHPLGPSM